ncbi:Crp/Fnr family transcriptional regulator [Chitinophaga lutea]
MLQPLCDHIRRFIPFDDVSCARLAQFFEVETYKRKAFLLREGEVCTAQYFVLEGCCRTFFTAANDTEHTHLFAIEGWWMTDAQSFEQRTPSQFHIQAVEQLRVAALRRDLRDGLLETLPQLERYFRIINERALAAANMRVKYLFSLSGEERYHNFATRFPEFLQRIPQYMLASYLGFTPEFLSKIRAKRIS